MDDVAELALVAFLVERGQFANAEDPPGIDGVRVGQQRGDVGNAQFRRPGGGGRARFRARPGDAGGRGIELGGPGGRFMEGQGHAGALEQRVQPCEPARRHGRRALAPGGCGQNHRAAGGGEREKIMRRRGDVRLRRRQAGGFAHRPAEPGAGLGHGRPHAFRQPAEHGDVHALQQRFLRAPDGDARMPILGARAADHGAGEQRVQQLRQVGGADSGRSARVASASRSSSESEVPASPDQSRAAPFGSAVSAKLRRSGSAPPGPPPGSPRPAGRAAQNAAPAGPRIPGRIRDRPCPAGPAALRSRAPGAGRAGPAFPGAWHDRGIVRVRGPAR